MEKGSTRHGTRSVATKSNDDGVRTWAPVAREGQPKSVNELPAQFRARIEKIAHSLKSGSYAPLPKRISQAQKMEAQYFRGMSHGPYGPLMTNLRSCLPSRCVIGLSFIGRPILEIVTASDVSHKLVAGMRAAGYTHMSNFSSTSNAISSRKILSKAERKKKYLEQALYRFYTAANRTTSCSAKHWYEAQVKMAEQMFCQNNAVNSAKDQKRRQANFENVEISTVEASSNMSKPHVTRAVNHLGNMRPHLRFTENSELTEKKIDGRADLRTHVRFAEDSTTSAV
ncbi:hypothetical protein FGB62_302g01 [Gracilaria domingensis]|nr:hypothetical protein FGB62_302g01 [Gracilaria domingensis]